MGLEERTICNHCRPPQFRDDIMIIVVTDAGILLAIGLLGAAVPTKEHRQEREEMANGF